jgi:tetratricopeptide (TPR) repeat protein
MALKPVIFVSAVSRELKSARQLVAHTLTFLGYEPDWQDIFGAEQGDLRDMLRRRIDASAGVVQIVGERYGAEPPSPDETFGRVSYTQFETLYARQRGKKVWYFFLEDGFPADPCTPEAEELARLQRDYRERIKTGDLLFLPLTSTDGLESSVLKLRDDLARLRRGVKQWAALVLALLVLLAAGLAVVTHRQKTQNVMLTRLGEQNNKVLSDLSQALDTIKGGSEAKLRSDYDSTVTFIARKNAISSADVRALLERNAARATKDPTVSPRDRVRALQEAGKFIEAREYALETARALATHKASREEVELWTEAARTETFLGHYKEALDYATQGVIRSNQIADFPTWAAARNEKGRAWFYQGNYKDAKTLFDKLILRQQAVMGEYHVSTLQSRRLQALITLYFDDAKVAEAEAQARPPRAEVAEAQTVSLIADCMRELGPEHYETLANRVNLGIALHTQEKDAAAETEYKDVRPIMETVLGPQHPDTLKCYVNLADALDAQGKHAEAEPLYRTVLNNRTRVLGKDHDDTLKSWVNLASVLNAGGKHEEAEKEFLELLPIMEQKLGTEYPTTLLRRMGLASALDAQGKYPQAEKELGAIVPIMKRKLGPKNSKTLACRLNLASALEAQGKHAEAESEFRDVLRIMDLRTDLDDPQVYLACYHLAGALLAQAHFEEALDFAERAEKGRRRVLGETHRDYKDAVTLREAVAACVKVAEGSN